MGHAPEMDIPDTGLELTRSTTAKARMRMFLRLPDR
jgi:hypothetical protein